jgi:N6-adenosine-specific RNA methylase IME4
MEFKPDGQRLVKELADDNAVLFMWVTAPLLKRCFPIIEAWGFDYKANLVWDKEKHVMGFYNSVRHEHLLIGFLRRLPLFRRPGGVLENGGV